MNNPSSLSPFCTKLLKPGDCILYSPSDVFDLAVVLKTWTRVSHVEVYVGDGYSVASRNGKGVDKYDARYDHVAAVRRPGSSFNLLKALEWFETKAKGHKYGWRTLLTFVLLNNWIGISNQKPYQ